MRLESIVAWGHHANSDFNLGSENRLLPELFCYVNNRNKNNDKTKERERNNFFLFSLRFELDFSAVCHQKISN